MRIAITAVCLVYLLDPSAQGLTGGILPSALLILSIETAVTSASHFFMLIVPEVPMSAAGSGW